MSQQSAFDRQNIEESAVIQPPGLLEQLNLPPAVVTFLRKNQRAVWIAAGCIALLAVSISVYKEYKERRDEKAATAFTLAMQSDGAEKKELLAQVVDEYGSTPSGLWGRIELAHLDVENGELVKAIQAFNDVKDDVKPQNPVMPLVLFALGSLYEKNNELDKAVDSFNQLSTYKGFEASSYEGMGRLYELQGQKVKAVEMYTKALAKDPEADPLQPGNPNQETIQARINSLQE